jgi:hypothetical protein
MEEDTFDELFGPLEQYQDSIRKATLHNFFSQKFINNWLCNITHLVVYQRVKDTDDFDDNKFNSLGMYGFIHRFEKLKRVEIDVDACDVEKGN